MELKTRLQIVYYHILHKLWRFLIKEQSKLPIIKTNYSFSQYKKYLQESLTNPNK